MSDTQSPWRWRWALGLAAFALIGVVAFVGSCILQNQSAGKPSYPPVWTRIPVALALGLGSNWVLVAGLSDLDDKRRVWLGRGLCGLALVMMGSGMGLMLALGFPATWNWYL